MPEQELPEEPLAIITEDKGYEPETTKLGWPKTEEEWEKVEEERVAWDEAEKIAEEHPETTTMGNSNPAIVTCPLCGEVIEIPLYDSVDRTDALIKHLEEKHKPGGV